MKRITTKAQLVELAQELGVSHNWHEPDEQDVTATTHGETFDNAGFWGGVQGETCKSACRCDFTELYVKLHKSGKHVASVNLATLFAWATGLKD